MPDFFPEYGVKRSKVTNFRENIYLYGHRYRP